ncbi:MAG TPA: hypothetical protein VJ976_09025 [Ornithinimicrobium sp.]|uniref:hypothetical protein n=1 Tax=Ornithinimicrobium sp. TaxID=1977084 RepID=UPI002B45F78B|nr:hypothetical protein [Ornithinimicrobium sp.]HKJ12511.1 hypothetical protein [Ornithinimicrobium sp.]
MPVAAGAVWELMVTGDVLVLLFLVGARGVREYGRSLPDVWWARELLMVVMIAAVVVVLTGWVFPLAAAWMPFNDSPVEG